MQFGALSDLSAWSLHGSTELQWRDIGKTPLCAEIRLGYSGYLPKADGLLALQGGLAGMALSYRLALSPTLAAYPRAELGYQMLFASYTSGGAPSAASGSELVGIAGLGLDLAIGRQWSASLQADYRMIAESGGLYHGAALSLGLGRRIKEWGEGSPTKPRLSAAQLAAARRSELLAPLKAYGNIRVTETAGLILIVVEGSFEPYATAPSAPMEEELATLVEVLGRLSPKSIEVQGYVAEDKSQDAAVDASLSLARARAIRDRLTANLALAAIPGGISAEGRGRSDPLADNASAEGRARNRRVELIVELE